MAKLKNDFYWVIQDSATKLFYRTTCWDFWENADPLPDYSFFPYEMEVRLSKAKKHNDLGKVKITLKNITLMYDFDAPLPDSAPEWAQGTGYVYPFVPTLEAVKFDRGTNFELERISLLPWYKEKMAGRKTILFYPVLRRPASGRFGRVMGYQYEEVTMGPRPASPIFKNPADAVAAAEAEHGLIHIVENKMYEGAIRRNGILGGPWEYEFPPE